MINPPHPDAAMDEMETAPWRKSSFSGDQGSCVETAPLTDGRIAVRNSNRPEAGVVFFTHTEMDAWIKGCKAGEFDDLRPATSSMATAGPALPAH